MVEHNCLFLWKTKRRKQLPKHRGDQNPLAALFCLASTRVWRRVTDWRSTSLRLSKILKMNSTTPVITYKASLIFFQLTYNHNPKLRDLRFGIQLRLNKLMSRTWGRYCRKLTRLQRVRDKTYTIAHTYSQLHTRFKITVINNEFPFNLFFCGCFS